ncbi:Methyltransf-25 domain-containing protein [Mycena indigotica]|uniref:Methyltransf-25 domain-containing protein n=1 Tax=Mycena indigotica TaxID=2126181 RepID=A0A8H6S7P6_9AGAR|nr:Methyltransf-25 domain-containing protein [Mycena indigotica]KAF7294560.1 Methyltransf-25 domain-containing protein [Mycena indigotica]
MASSHNHPHPHHAHGHDYASANQAFFDQHAHEADQRHGAGELAKDIRDAILQAYKFDDQSTTLLDFACGTGIVSLGLAERCKKVVGVDISQGMVDQYNKNAAERDISSQALRIELKGEDSELDGTKFDVVMCSLAYHHIQDIVSTTRLLSFFLKPVPCRCRQSDDCTYPWSVTSGDSGGV